jgi:FMN phosphatase YigB (HAD superfamily)
MRAVDSLVFLLDVDNTLLDNDRLKADLDSALQAMLGPAGTRRFWEIYEEVRAKKDYVDYPATVREFSKWAGDAGLGPQLEEVLEGLPLRSYVFPGVFDTIASLKAIGTPVILSDGDPVFQPLKIRKSGLEAAVEGRVIISVHKELELSKVFETYPARHYVVVDDKPRILSKIERVCPARCTTVLVLQGKYAADEQDGPSPDFRLERITDLKTLTAQEFGAQ